MAEKQPLSYEQQAQLRDTAWAEMMADRIQNPGTREDALREMSEVSSEATEARIDSLTGLPNHRAFEGRLKDSASLSRRLKVNFGVVDVDVADLKTYNDIDHAIGDQALRTVAEAMKKVARSHEYPARVGGDEFAMAAVNGDLHAFVERLEKELAQPENYVEDAPIRIYAGFGSGKPKEAGETVYHRAQKHLSDQKELAKSSSIS